MKKTDLIAIIRDSDFGYKNKTMINPKVRFAARGIVVNEQGLIAVFHKVNKNEYKLPGGGIENNESPEETFAREVMEETGCLIGDIRKLGVIEEDKSQNNFKQISHVYLAKCVDNTHNLHLTNKEEDEGGEVLWMEINEALRKMRECIKLIKPSKYESVYITKFIVKRDISILEYYLKNNRVSC